MKRKFESNNEYAKNIKGKEKHISEVEKGRKGYYCLGCDEEVEARKGDKIAHYFAHVPKDVKRQRKCTYSDETYRHELAKIILQRIKQVKVPALYKYKNSNETLSPRKIRDAWFVTAYNVKIGRQFYENKVGEIKYGRSIDIEADKDKYLLIRPDVIFFDKNDKPILLIELVATHEITPEEFSKIKRLGIDTIQIRIPKASPKEIEEVFYKSTKTEWIFNNEREQTNYLSLPKGINEGVLQLNKFQERLLREEETFRCRSSQIKNLIRAIGKSLESEQYRRIENNLRNELARVKENSRRNQERRQSLEREYRKSIKEQYKLEEKGLEEEERKLDQRDKEFQKYASSMEKKYLTKRESLEKIQREYEPKSRERIKEIEQELERLGGNGTTPSERIENLRKEGRGIKNEAERVKKCNEKEQRIFANLKKGAIELRTEFEQFEERIKQEFDDRRRELEERVRQEFDKLRREVTEAIKNRDSEGTSRIYRRIRKTISDRELLLSIRKKQSSIKRLGQIKQVFDEKSYKDWI